MVDIKLTGIYLCKHTNGHTDVVDISQLADYAKNFLKVPVIWNHTDVDLINVNALAKIIQNKKLERIVIAGNKPGMEKSFFSRAMVKAGKSPANVVLADFKEHGAITKSDTDLAKAILACAINGVPFEIVADADEEPVNPATVVIGAGIAGIQASLEVADSGNKVYLIEKTGTIGGHMAMFDKTFPTLDCAACILTPKMVDVGQHPNIEILSLSEVTKVEGIVGDFKVKIRKKARYVNDKCTGCGDCLDLCPVSNQPQIQLSPDYSKLISSEDKQKLDNIFSNYSSNNNGSPDKQILIQVLQNISSEFNYLPEYSLKYVSEIMKLPLSQVYHVATFYSAFSLIPMGDHIVKVCMGTACYARGSSHILDRIESILGIKPDQTTDDKKFTLQTVGCLGCCALGPVVNVDGDYHQMSLSKVEKVIDKYYKINK